MSFEQVTRKCAEAGWLPLIVLAIISIFALLRLLRWWSSDPVIAFSKDDPAFLKAIEEARATLDGFWSDLEVNQDGEALYAVKVAFEARGGREHVWLLVSQDGRQTCKGVLMNRPQHLTLREGDEVTFSADDITDWLIMDQAGMKGGHTIRAMIRSLPEKQGRKMADMHRIAYEAALRA